MDHRTQTTPGPRQVARFRIEGMCCSAEEGMIRRRLELMAGIEALEFNLVQRTLAVHHNLATEEPLVGALRSLRLDPVPLEAGAPTSPRKVSWSTVALVAATIAALGAEACELLGWGQPWLPAVLALVAVGLSGWKVYLKGWASVKALDLNISALMSLAVTGALVLQLWPEAAMVMVLFSVAERLEDAAMVRARKAVAGLVEQAPTEATVYGIGGWTTVPSAEVEPGTRVRVRPGERMSHDGRVTKGCSTVNQAPITGESVPVDKAVGDPVFAGTVNLQGELEFVVTAGSSSSVLARILHLVEEAQASRAPTQRAVDAFARIYTPVVVGLAVVLAVVPPLLGWGTWGEWVYRALVLLVIACPCALVLSTPVTVVSALAAAARMGILVKGGAFLEQGRHLKTVVFDKTGTLTHGRPRVTDERLLVEPRARVWASSLAQRSDHPVSRALVTDDGLEVEGFEAVPGRGVRGRVEGHELVLGSRRWMVELGLGSSEFDTLCAALESQGKTVVALAEQGVLAVFAVADTVKEGALEAVTGLRQRGVRPVLLSGDSKATVAVVAADLGIEARGELLPEDKLSALAEWSTAGPVAMVGDGINDAPALARAEVGFAMGRAGTGLAVETADVVLMDDDPGQVVRFIDLSRRTWSILVQNIAFALGTKALFFVLTLVGWGTMGMAVFADTGTAVLVVLNGLRLLAPQVKVKDSKLPLPSPR